MAVTKVRRVDVLTDREMEIANRTEAYLDQQISAGSPRPNIAVGLSKQIYDTMFIRADRVCDEICSRYLKQPSDWVEAYFDGDDTGLVFYLVSDPTEDDNGELVYPFNRETRAVTELQNKGNSRY